MAADHFTSVFAHSLDYVGSLLTRLQELVPMDLWMATRTHGEQWIVVKSCDHGYGVRNGDQFRWSDSFCSRMVRGQGPFVAPNANAVPAYVEAPIGRQVPIGAYIGVPLLRADHSLFGTLCAIDPNPKPENLVEQLPLVQDFAGAIAGLLRLAEQDAVDLRVRTCEDLATHRDAFGFYDIHGLHEFCTTENERLDTLGMPAGVALLQISGQTNGCTQSQDEEAKAPMLLRGWAGKHGCFVSRLSSNQFVLLLPGMDPLAMEQALTQLGLEMKKLGLETGITWGMRNLHEDYEATIRHCLAADHATGELQHVHTLAH